MLHQTASPNGTTSPMAAVFPWAAALLNGVAKPRHETTLSLNGATLPTGHLDAVLLIGQYYA